jgi:hypothetical protein
MTRQVFFFKARRPGMPALVCFFKHLIFINVDELSQLIAHQDGL